MNNFQKGNEHYKKKNKREYIYPEWEEGLKLLEQTKNIRDNIMIRLMLFQGLREGEIVGSYTEKHGKLKALTPSNIDFNNEIIFVVGKGESNRYVFLDKTTLNLLKEYIVKRNIKPNNPIFLISTRQLQYIVKECARSAHVSDAERYSPHVLRALSITRMAQKVGLKRAQLHARHSSHVTTLIYDRPSMKDRLESFKNVFEADK